MEKNILGEIKNNPTVEIGDVIVTNCGSTGNSIADHNFYKVIGLENCHGKLAKQGLLNLRYNYICTKFIPLEENIITSAEGYFNSIEENVARVIKNEMFDELSLLKLVNEDLQRAAELESSYEGLIGKLKEMIIEI
jgi:hypothetical protein